jgi:hypothetical protein
LLCHRSANQLTERSKRYSDPPPIEQRLIGIRFGDRRLSAEDRRQGILLLEGIRDGISDISLQKR